MIMNSILGLEAGAVGRKSVDPAQGAEKSTNFSDFTDALAASDDVEEAASASAEGDTLQGDSVPDADPTIEEEIPQPADGVLQTAEDVRETEVEGDNSLVVATARPETNHVSGHTVSMANEPEGVPVDAISEQREGVPTEIARTVETSKAVDQRASDGAQNQPEELATQARASGKEVLRSAVEGAADERSRKPGNEFETLQVPHGNKPEQQGSQTMAPSEQAAATRVVSAPSGKVGNQETGGTVLPTAARPSEVLTDAEKVEITRQRVAARSDEMPELVRSPATAAPQVTATGEIAPSGQVGNREAIGTGTQIPTQASAALAESGAIETSGQRVSNPSNAMPEQAHAPAPAASQMATSMAKQGRADLSEQPIVQARGGVNVEGPTGASVQPGSNSVAAAVAAPAFSANNPISDSRLGRVEHRDVSRPTDSDESVTTVKIESSALSRYDVRVSGSPQTQQSGLVPTFPQFSLPTGGSVSIGAESGPFSASLEMTSEMPGLSQLLTEATFGTSATHRSELPRMVASQMAEAFAAKGEQKVEVSLNPQELGKVSMRVVTSETGITMVIQTERPETGDLMRRHIHELAEEFRQMGYEDISFEFSGGQADGGQFQDQSAGGSGNADSLHLAEVAEPAVQNLQLGTAGVDMRV